MSKNGYKRRDFMFSTLKVVAVAAGMNPALLRRLLAGSRAGDAPGRNPEYSIYQRSANEQIKALKVLIENNQRIFENEYGRITPLEKGYFDPSNPGALLTLCRIEWLQPEEIVNSCNVVHSAGGSCGLLHYCGMNSCGGQKCPELMTCPNINGCPDQKCPSLQKSGNKLPITGSFFAEFGTDPYVQYLFKRFNAASAEDLASQANALLRQTR